MHDCHLQYAPMCKYLQAKSLAACVQPKILAASPDIDDSVLYRHLFTSMVVVTMQSCKDNWQYGSHQNSAELHQGQALPVAYDLWQYVYA